MKIHPSGTVPHTLANDGFTLLPSLTSEIDITKHETSLLVRFKKTIR